MGTDGSMGITTIPAVLALVGGLSGMASATILSAGGFPGGATSAGIARCMITNTGKTGVVVNSVELRNAAGGVIDTGLSGFTVAAGYTLAVASALLDPAAPTSCVFDLSTSRGVRAAFVYQDGTNFTVIPAVK